MCAVVKRLVALVAIPFERAQSAHESCRASRRCSSRKLRARWSGSRRTAATTAAVRVLVDVVVVRVVSMSNATATTPSTAIAGRGSRQVRTRQSTATAAVRVLAVIVVAVRVFAAARWAG